MLNGTSGVSTGVALIAVAGVCVSLLGTVPASSDPEGSLNKEKALVTACMKAIRVFAPNPGDDPFVHSVTNQYSNPDGTENPASTRSSRGKATELELSVLPDYNQVHDRELQEDGRFVGFIRNKSFDKDNPLDVASKTYNVFGGDTTCVFIGRARDESPITGSASPKNVVRGLRSLLVHQGVSQARRARVLGVVRAVHEAAHPNAMTSWSKEPTGAESNVDHWIVTSFRSDLLYRTDDEKRNMSQFQLMTRSLSDPGPWFTCAVSGCCKVQK